MKNLLMTAAIVAVLATPLPTLAQDAQDLERLVNDAIDAPADDDLGAAEVDDSELDLMTDEEIDDLVAPVALYPDSLLAQVLVAATFPLQIVQADRILEDSDDMTDDEVTEAIDARDWDPSVLVLLTGFPDVIRRMAEDLDDTESLGIAMAQQDQDVLDSVQRLREQAEATGWLADNEAQTVARVDDRIVIEPTKPDVIYVPRYDESKAFVSAPTADPVIIQQGAPQQSFNPLLAGAIGFGSALLVNEMFGDDGDGKNGNKNKNGWEDYWRKDRRAIDWRDRQVYPRATYWDDDGLRREAAWSRERDRYWDRDGKRWRADQAEQRRDRWRDDDWVVRRDKDGRAQVKLKDWSDVRAAIEQQDRRLDRTEQALEADRKRDAAAAREVDRRREAAAEREREARREAAQRDRAREERQDDKQAAARREKAAEDRKAAEAADRKRAQERAEAREKAEADRERQARREAAQDKQQQAAAREKAEADKAARAKAEAAADRDAARKAAADRERQAERAKAEAADESRKKAAAAEKRESSRQATSRAQQEPKREAKQEPKREAKPQERAKPQQAETRQAQKPRKAEAREQPKKKQQRCADGKKGADCRNG